MLNRIDPATLFPGCRIGARTLLAKARWEVGGYLIGRTFYLSDEQVAELVECFRHEPHEPFKPPLRLPPPNKRVSEEDKKLFDRAIAALRQEADRELRSQLRTD